MGATLTLGVPVVDATDGITVTIPITGNSGNVSLPATITDLTLRDSVHGVNYPIRSSSITTPATLIVVLDVWVPQGDTLKVDILATSNLTDAGGNTAVGQTNIAVTNNSTKQFYIHHTSDFGAMSDVAEGGAIPGWTQEGIDFSGSTVGEHFKVLSGILSEVGPVGGLLTLDYSDDNRTDAFELVFEFPAQASHNFRTPTQGPTVSNVGDATQRNFFNLAGAIFTAPIQDSGAESALVSSGAIGLDTTHAYRVRFRGQVGTLGFFRRWELYDRTAAAPVLWNGGFDTYYQYELGSGRRGHTVRVALYGGDGTYSKITYADGIPSAVLTPGQGTHVTHTDDSINMVFAAPTGGTGALTWRYLVADDLAGLNQQYLDASFDNQTTVNLTGLLRHKAYLVTQEVTDETPETVSGFDVDFRITGVVSGAKTLDWPLLDMTAIGFVGDSTDYGGTAGSTRSADVMAAAFEDLMGLPYTPVVEMRAQSGFGVRGYVNSDLTLTTYATNTVTAFNTQGVTVVWDRIGLNDELASVTEDAMYDAISFFIDEVFAGAPSVRDYVVNPPMFHYGPPSAGVATVPYDEPSIDAWHRVRRKIVATKQPPAGKRILLGCPHVPRYFLQHPGQQPDSTHPSDPEGYASKGLLDAYWYLYSADYGYHASNIGPGFDEVTVPVVDNGTPLPGAIVYVSGDADGNNIVAGPLVADSSGEVLFRLDDGADYYLRGSDSASGKGATGVAFTAEAD